MIPVSVIIPTYNRSHCLGDAIDSVLAQTHKNLEIIVVDDGSTDGTKDIVRSYGWPVKYIYQTNQGVSAARNRGIKEARSEWIAFLDSDDEWHQKKIETQLIFTQKHPEICAHLTNVTIVHDGKKSSLFSIREKPNFAIDGLVIDRPLILTLQMQFFTQSLLVNKNSILKAGLFDTAMSLHEDTDLLSRLALLGAWGVSNSQLATIYRKGPGAMALSSQHIQHPIFSLQSMLKIFANLSQHQALSVDEITFIRKGLSGYRFSLAMEYRHAGDYKSCFSGILQSVKDFPSIRSVAKALLGILLGPVGFKKLLKLLCINKNKFRRSLT